VAAVRHGDPDLARQLGGQPVELQRGQQAEHGLRHLGCHHHEAFVFRDRMAGWAVQATPDPVQQTSGGQACQDDPGHVDGVQIAGAQQPLLAGQIEDALAVGAGGHGRIMFHVFAKCSIWEKNRNTLRLRPGYPMR
jgi:hypothetical protein